MKWPIREGKLGLYLSTFDLIEQEVKQQPESSTQSGTHTFSNVPETTQNLQLWLR